MAFTHYAHRIVKICAHFYIGLIAAVGGLTQLGQAAAPCSAAPERLADQAIDESVGCGCNGGVLQRDAVDFDGAFIRPASSVGLTSGSAPMTVTSEPIDTTQSTYVEDVPRARMVYIPGGEFIMGHANHSLSPATFYADGEGPPRKVQVTRPPKLPCIRAAFRKHVQCTGDELRSGSPSPLELSRVCGDAFPSQLSSAIAYAAGRWVLDGRD